MHWLGQESRETAFHPLTSRLRPKCKIAADRRQCRQEHRSVLTSTKSSDIVRLSGKDFIDSVLSHEPAVAVFDCDGTLWAGDSGYDFMIWSIEEGLIVSRSASDWIDSRYRLYRAGTGIGNRDLRRDGADVRRAERGGNPQGRQASFFRIALFADKFVPRDGSPWSASLQADRGTDIWVVSSTNNWVIEVGRSQAIKISASRVEYRCPGRQVTGQV